MYSNTLKKSKTFFIFFLFLKKILSFVHKKNCFLSSFRFLSLFDPNSPRYSRSRLINKLKKRPQKISTRLTIQHDHILNCDKMRLECIKKFYFSLNFIKNTYRFLFLIKKNFFLFHLFSLSFELFLHLLLFPILSLSSLHNLNSREQIFSPSSFANIKCHITLAHGNSMLAQLKQRLQFFNFLSG